MLKRKAWFALWTFLFLSHKFVRAFTSRVLLGSHVCDIKDMRYHTDDNYCIIFIGPKLKSTFSSSKHHRSLWLDFFFLDVFSPKNVSFAKQKAALDSEVTTKLPMAVCFAAENKSAASHFNYAMKTESVEISAD